ncbi:MAG: hypothetical protein AB1576_07035 [Bacillota bacterium]|jgi:aspartokinase-like uncharacterized kinase
MDRVRVSREGLVVVKVGGSLLGAPGSVLRQLGKTLSSLAASGHDLAVVPGGGLFADTVRRVSQGLSLSDEASHFMAVLAMDQHAWVLRDLVPGSHVTGYPRPALSPGRVAVLLSFDLARSVPQDRLPRAWEATSDSIAACWAEVLEARSLVMLKSASGLMGPGGEGLVPTITRDRLPTAMARQGGEPLLDPYFTRSLPPRIPVWVIDGRCPGRLREVLSSGTTTGTLITPGGAAQGRAPDR